MTSELESVRWRRVLLLVVCWAGAIAVGTSDPGRPRAGVSDSAGAGGARESQVPVEIRGSEAEALFSEAEELRLRYGQQASRQAAEKYAAALAAWRRAGEHRAASRASERLGMVHEQIGDPEQALAWFEEALALSRRHGDPGLESEMLSRVGLTALVLGDHERGSGRCREALGLAGNSGSLRAEARALSCLGEVEYHRGSLTRAVRLHRRSQELWLGLADPAGQAQALTDLGFAHLELGEHDQAKASQERAIDLWEATGDKRGEASSRVGLGRIHEELGEFQEALGSYRQAMRLVEPLGDVLWKASILSGIGSIYENLGEEANAERNWTAALERFRKAGVRIAEADILLSIGEMNLGSGKTDAALTRFEQALSLSRELAHTRLESTALHLIGQVHQAGGATRTALGFYQQARSRLEPGEDRRYEAFLLSDIASVIEELGEPESAAQYYGQALELSTAARDPSGEAGGLYNLARLMKARGDLPMARQHIEDSLRVVESLRSGVASPELRASFLASVHRYYELHVELLMALGSSLPNADLAAEALRASERSRARSLLESLSEAGVDVRSGADPGLLAAEKALEQNLESRTARLIRLLGGEADGAEIEALEGEIQALRFQYQQLQAEIRTKSPRYAALTQPQPVSVKEIQDQLLDEETLLLEYALGEERSFLWAVSKDTFTSYELPPRKELEQAARDVYGLLTARLDTAPQTASQYWRRVREADGRYWAVAARLSETLLAPVSEQLAGKRLLIVADGALRYIPFAALPVPRTGQERIPLVVEHEIVTLPSASVMAVLRRGTAGRTPAEMSVAVLADPVFELADPRVRSRAAPGGTTDSAGATEAPNRLRSGVFRALRQAGFAADGKLRIPRLPATRQEASAIVAAAGAGTSLQAIGFDASRETAMSPELGRYRIVHFATHGLLNSENPGLSGIMLSTVDERGQARNGFLGLHDIFNLELPV